MSDTSNSKPTQVSGRISAASQILRIQAQADDISKSIDARIKEEAEESFVLETSSYASAELRRLHLKNERRKDNNDLRKTYAEKAYQLAVYSVGVWSLIFIAVAIANGAAGKPPLSDSALMTLTAGATVNVLTAFLAIVRGLFPTKSRNSSKARPVPPRD